MVYVNIFYNENEKELFSKLRLNLWLYFSKKEEENGGYVRKEDYRVYTQDVVIVFVAPKERHIVRTKMHGELIFNYELCDLNEIELYDLLDKLYIKKEYFVLDKSCERPYSFNKQEFYSCFKKRIMNEYEKQCLDSAYWTIFETKNEMLDYILSHLNMIIEEQNKKVMLLERSKQELKEESEGW